MRNWTGVPNNPLGKCKYLKENSPKNERLEGEEMMTEFSFLGELSL